MIMNKTQLSRRKFIITSTIAGAGVGLAGPFSLAQGKSKRQGEQAIVAIMGGRGRASALARSFAKLPEAHVKSIFDVDSRPLNELAEEVEKLQGRKPGTGTDFRRALDDKDIDALVIAAPDHWHTPAAIMALQAGKHVYVEKPGSHNPAEAELIVRARQRYNKLVQMGNQQRSSAESIQAMSDIADGLIGEPYYAKAFYANTRGSIGKGSIAQVPDWLDYELWQGPAPRTPYRDNIIHYNWHWFWKWGTGEILNNGTHEYDIARWALGVDLPNRINSSGGRFHFNDDWEFYDVQNVTFDFPEGKSITWEGRSANGYPFHNRGRGTTIHGTKGTILIDRNGYIVYDLENTEVKRMMQDIQDPDQLNTVGEGILTDSHTRNFVMAILDGEKLNSPIDEGQRSVISLHLGNISQFVGRSLNIDTRTGRIIGDSEAMSMWSRRYQPGWEPSI
jgi:predicted dehydrogenase